MKHTDISEVEGYDILKNLYENNIKRALDGKNHCPKIPKSIHQIWIGPNKIPEIYQKATEMIQAKHPNWKYRLWTDEDVKNFDFPDKDLYNKASTYTEKADILRYSILQKYGGVYLDVGIFTLKPLDFLVDNFSFFSHLERGAINNNVVGMAKNIPVMKYTLSNIRKNWSHETKKFLNSLNNKTISRTTIRDLALGRSLRQFNLAVMQYINSADELEKPCMIVLPITYNGIRFKPKIYDPIKSTATIDGKKYNFRQNYKETIAMKVKLKKIIVNDLTDYGIDEKIPLYKKIIKNIRDYLLSIQIKLFGIKSLEKYEN